MNIPQSFFIEDVAPNHYYQTERPNETRHDTDDGKNVAIRSRCSSGEWEKSINCGNMRHMLRPSSMIGVRQTEQETFVGV